MTSSQNEAANAADLSVSILTCSFRGDFEYCKILCESVDRFVPDDIEQILVVPARDVPLFSQLANHRRRVVNENEVLPRWLKKLPMPPAKWRQRLRLPRRDIYLAPGSMLVRGWIVQQIMKICAASQMQTEIIVHLDSDTVMVRPIDGARLLRGPDRVMLYQNPQSVELDTHHEYHRVAAELLGIAPLANSDEEYDYVDSFVVWRRSVVAGMIARIEQVGGRDFALSLARKPLISEYVLYGTFAARVLGLEAAKLAAEPQSSCHSRWVGAFTDAHDEQNFIQSIEPQHVACLMQSTLNLSLPDRQRIVEQVTRVAAEQDRRALTA